MSQRLKEQEEIILQIGYISLYFNKIELLITDGILIMLDNIDDRIGMVLIEKKKVFEKQELFFKMCKILIVDESIKKLFDAQNKSIDEIRKERNKYLHGLIYSINFGHEQEEYFISKGVQLEVSEKISITTLKNLVKRLEEVYNEQIICTRRIKYIYETQKEDYKIKQDLYNQMINEEGGGAEMNLF